VGSEYYYNIYSVLIIITSVSGDSYMEVKHYVPTSSFNYINEQIELKYLIRFITLWVLEARLITN